VSLRVTLAAQCDEIAQVVSLKRVIKQLVVNDVVYIELITTLLPRRSAVLAGVVITLASHAADCFPRTAVVLAYASAPSWRVSARKVLCSPLAVARVATKRSVLGSALNLTFLAGDGLSALTARNRHPSGSTPSVHSVALH